MTKRVLKWIVEVNDTPQMIGSGPVVHVDCQSGPDIVTIWTEEHDTQPQQRREVQVYGTGHPIPLFAEHVGSVVTGGGALVWHVYELPQTTTGSVVQPAAEAVTASVRPGIIGSPIREQWP
jgi:hypothetical protein